MEFSSLHPAHRPSSYQARVSVAVLLACLVAGLVTLVALTVPAAGTHHGVAAILSVATVTTDPAHGPAPTVVTIPRTVATTERTVAPIAATVPPTAATVPPTAATVPPTAATIPPTAATVPRTAATVNMTVSPVASLADECSVALAYLAAHAKPGFAHFCRPESLKVGIAHAVAFTCVPGAHFACPDGVAEIIIADPACAVSYENEASNSYWDFSTGGVITPSTVQNGRTWDPYGGCP